MSYYANRKATDNERSYLREYAMRTRILDAATCASIIRVLDDLQLAEKTIDKAKSVGVGIRSGYVYADAGAGRFLVVAIDPCSDYAIKYRVLANDTFVVEPNQVYQMKWNRFVANVVREVCAFEDWTIDK